MQIRDAQPVSTCRLSAQRQDHPVTLLLSTGLAACASILNNGSSDVYSPENLANRLKLAFID
jgi:hypothetical protein